MRVLANTICAVKDRVRWRAPAWKAEFCQKVAHAVLESSERYQVPPALILAVMINESDMNEATFRTTAREGAVYAKDGGLMGIRCIVDKRGRCGNGHVRGMTWKEVMDPATNIALGARELAHYRDGGGVAKVTVRTRDDKGQLVVRQKYVACPHKNHASGPTTTTALFTSITGRPGTIPIASACCTTRWREPWVSTPPRSPPPVSR